MPFSAVIFYLKRFPNITKRGSVQSGKLRWLESRYRMKEGKVNKGLRLTHCAPLLYGLLSIDY